jgi:hypothetical protein
MDPHRDNCRTWSEGSDQGETVRVRIAVAVSADQAWSAVGNCAYETDEEVADVAADCLLIEAAGMPRVSFITAEIPAPPRCSCRRQTGGEQ